MSQPVLPPEQPYTDIERAFIEHSPPGLFPTNQDSNIGQLRRVVTDELQAKADELTVLWQEMFPDSASLYLSLWEYMLGLTVAPSGKTLDERRAYIKARRRKGTFTRSLRDQIIENFLFGTTGSPIELTPEGVPLVAGGVPLYGEAVSVKNLYRVYEYVPNFTYDVWINNSNAVNVANLLRELERITPAGITPIIDNTKSNVLSYYRTVRNDNPVVYFELNDNNDLTFSGITATVNGGLVVGGVAAPGLVTSTGNDERAATNFDGVDDSLQIVDYAPLNITEQVTVEAWINASPTEINGAIFDRTIGGTTNKKFLMFLDNLGRPIWRIVIGNVLKAVTYTASDIRGAVRHLVGTYDGEWLRLWIDSVLVAELAVTGKIDSGAGVSFIGRLGLAGFEFVGDIQHLAVYNYALSQTQIINHWNAGKNILA
jgi:hypothetical protein